MEIWRGKNHAFNVNTINDVAHVGGKTATCSTNISHHSLRQNKNDKIQQLHN